VTERSESWKKSRLDERLQDVVFITLFVPGVIFGAVGTSSALDGVRLRRTVDGVISSMDHYPQR
jgi:hypothetical protein